MENRRPYNYRKCAICGVRQLPKSNTLLSRFPLDPDRCRIWVKATGDEDLIHLPIEKLYKLKFICGSHFAPECFNQKGNRLLKTAVPTERLTRPLLSDDSLNEFPLHVKSFYNMGKNKPDVPVQYEPMPSRSATSAAPPLIDNNTGVHWPQVLDTGSTQLPSQVAGAAPPNAPVDSGTASQLDDELLEILGDDPSQPVLYGKDIQTDLSVRLQHIATSGLTKETRKKLLDRYLVPGNCTLIGAPVLNLEVKAAISEAVLRKDKAIELKQQQLASATSCVAEALTILMSAEVKNTTIIQLLMDACKILCDSQNADSNTRRNFVQLNIKKELKEQLLATKIDKFLFSNELAETLKAAKAISKSGADLKIPSAKHPTKLITPKPSQKHLNWKGPPPGLQAEGEPKGKKPVFKTRHEGSLKKSSRTAPTSNRSRR